MVHKIQHLIANHMYREHCANSSANEAILWAERTEIRLRVRPMNSLFVPIIKKHATSCVALQNVLAQMANQRFDACGFCTADSDEKQLRKFAIA